MLRVSFNHGTLLLAFQVLAAAPDAMAIGILPCNWATWVALSTSMLAPSETVRLVPTVSFTGIETACPLEGTLSMTVA